MMILMLENGGGTESINQLVIMFLLMNSRNGGSLSSSDGMSGHRCHGDCGRDDGFTF